MEQYGTTPPGLPRGKSYFTSFLPVAGIGVELARSTKGFQTTKLQKCCERGCAWCEGMITKTKNRIEKSMKAILKISADKYLENGPESRLLEIICCEIEENNAKNACDHICSMTYLSVKERKYVCCTSKPPQTTRGSVGMRMG